MVQLSRIAPFGLVPMVSRFGNQNRVIPKLNIIPDRLPLAAGQE
jgi:hypothetical protein